MIKPGFVALDEDEDIKDIKRILERRVKELDDTMSSDDNPEFRAAMAMDELFFMASRFFGVRTLGVEFDSKGFSASISLEFAKKVLEKI